MFKKDQLVYINGDKKDICVFIGVSPEGQYILKYLLRGDHIHAKNAKFSRPFPFDPLNEVESYPPDLDEENPETAKK